MSTPTIALNARIVPAFTIADRLRKAREIAGYEQGELATVSGISRGTISSAETGKSLPHRSTLALWSAATGVSLEWIENGEAPSESEGAHSVPPGRIELPTYSLRVPEYATAEHLIALWGLDTRRSDPASQKAELYRTR